MPASSAAQSTAVEIAVIPGIEDIAADEIVQVIRPNDPIRIPRPGTIVLSGVDPGRVLTLRTAGVAYLTRDFRIPRPRALLGSQHFLLLVDLVQTVLGGGVTFSALRLSAAGAQSAVLQRLAEELAIAVGLPVDQRDGDLVVRVFRGSAGGWTVGVRLTPRPLSARPWRRPDFQGALEATVGAAMVRLSAPHQDDVFADLCCGSGTITAERLLLSACKTAIAVDVADDALEAASTNFRSAGVRGGVSVVKCDATCLPLGGGTVTSACANPPWGHQMGNNAWNQTLYPRLLAEAARVVRADHRFVILTHEIRLTQRLLANHTDWTVLSERRISLRGHHPRIWVLRRR